MTERFDKRNTLNDLSGKEWLKNTKSFWLSEKSIHDKDAFDHPAPFLIKDIMKLISLFTKKHMRVLDPFCGSGTTLIASLLLERYGIGIDINEDFKDLSYKRIEKIFEPSLFEKNKFEYHIGDSNEIISKIQNVDYIVTSPPYHNILKNKGNGTRTIKKNGYRNGARIGVEYYSELPEDLGNQKTYNDFLKLLKEIMEKAYNVLKYKKYCSVIISDFTVEKKEICVHGDIVKIMEEIGFEFCGTTILLQDNKPLYPFGYPYAYKINHMHQNIINFRK
ncbi:MAG: hypothetical protein JXA68_12015 [Ignavibacteriales bacterium]|nr:hypothetical protein [Ignavibacteriales bacterium]